MHRIADDLVFFEDRDAELTRRQLTCCLQSRRACANDDCVIHPVTSFHLVSSTVNVDNEPCVYSDAIEGCGKSAASSQRQSCRSPLRVSFTTWSGGGNENGGRSKFTRRKLPMGMSW